jgi:hypothetical protein
LLFQLLLTSLPLLLLLLLLLLLGYQHITPFPPISSSS